MHLYCVRSLVLFDLLGIIFYNFIQVICFVVNCIYTEDIFGKECKLVCYLLNILQKSFGCILVVISCL